jgi:hypothetical protein
MVSPLRLGAASTSSCCPQFAGRGSGVHPIYEDRSTDALLIRIALSSLMVHLAWSLAIGMGVVVGTRR